MEETCAGGPGRWRMFVATMICISSTLYIQLRLNPIPASKMSSFPFFFLVYKISFILWESHMQTQHILLIFSTSSPLHPLLTTCGILIVSVVMTEWSLKEMILKMKNAAISDILIWGWILIWNDNIHSFHLMVTSPANLELGKHHSNHKFVLT